MQSYRKTIQFGLAIAAGVLLMATALRPQPLPPVGPVWEYTSVMGSPWMQGNNNGGDGRATICQATTSGCKNDAADNMMMAAAKLGERGWELAAVTDVSSGSRTERIMYFKRLRSVLNKNDR